MPAEPLPSMDTEEGFAAHREWEAKLAEARWSVVSWPEEYGGRGASLVEWVIFEEEYYRAGAPGRVSQNGIFLLAPIIFDHGTQEQQDRFLPSMATGEQVWAQAWSEPEAGSDLASLQVDRPPRRRPRRLGAQRPEDLVVAGVLRALGLRAVPLRPGGAAARRADLLPVPARRRRASPSARSPSSTARPGFAEIFLEDVFVPDSDVLGAPGDGWRVAMSTAGNERGLSLRSPGRFCAAADRLVDLYRGGFETGARRSTTDSVETV